MLDVTEEYAQFFEKENRRCSHEWDQWGGSMEEAAKINDKQCERILNARERMENHGLAR